MESCKRVSTRAATALIALASVLANTAGAAPVPEGIWAIAGKVALRVFDCSGSLCGQVVWLQDETLRTPAMCGRTIIWGLKPDGADDW